MRKKIKITFILLLLIELIFNSIKEVKAHSIELDPQSVISLPWFITAGSGTITISSSITNYSLYYQAVQIPNTVYSQIEKINSDGEDKSDTLKEQYSKLKTEMDNLKTTYDEANKAYQAGKDGTESETLKSAYEKAKTEYENKAKEYSSKIEEYNKKVEEINNQIKDLIPTYVEGNWVQIRDNKFSVDLTQFVGKQAFAIWVKLVTNDGKTYYDEGTYVMSGTKKTETNVKSISLDKTSLSMEEGSNYTLTATITPSDATNKSLIWSSDNEKVATVTNGKVTGIAKGFAKITVSTVDGNYSASCNVTITEKVTESSKEKTNTEEVKKIDNTTVSGDKLPQTGFSYVIPLTVVTSVSVLAFIFYKKNKYLDFK